MSQNLYWYCKHSTMQQRLQRKDVNEKFMLACCVFPLQHCPFISLCCGTYATCVAALLCHWFLMATQRTWVGAYQNMRLHTIVHCVTEFMGRIGGFCGTLFSMSYLNAMLANVRYITYVNALKKSYWALKDFLQCTSDFANKVAYFRKSQFPSTAPLFLVCHSPLFLGECQILSVLAHLPAPSPLPLPPLHNLWCSCRGRSEGNTIEQPFSTFFFLPPMNPWNIFEVSESPSKNQFIGGRW